MKSRAGADPEQRVLALVPTSKDEDLLESIVSRAGIPFQCCARLDEICDELDKGAAALLLPEETLSPDQAVRLTHWLWQQPKWSDIPLLVLARSGADSTAVARAMDLLGNVTVLERPIRVAALVSALRAALRARQRQYQIRTHLEELRKSADALQEADRRKDEFLALLAHELRNPLAPILNSVQILRLGKADQPVTSELTEIMERQVHHMVRLVDELLEVSRVSRGKIVLKKEVIDVRSVLRAAVETSQPFISAGKHTLVVSTDPQPLSVEGDSVRLIQVVTNLLNNAAKYSEPGSEILLSGRRDGDSVSISVKDTGRGIPAGMLSKVFDLFTQIDRDIGLAQGGLGIGLTLVKSLVELHGGSVEAVSSGEGAGSEFVVRLPHCTKHSTSGESGGLASEAEVLCARKILVVDDNQDAANMLGLLLSQLGAEVQVTYNGETALQKVASFEPSIVLLDIGMPGMDGHEVAQKIRKSKSNEPTIIALTGWGQESDREQTQASGFDHHLIKPADIHALKELLASIELR